MPTKKQTLFSLLFIVMFILATVSAWIYAKIDSSLPILEGKKTIYGLIDNTIVERDINGVPSITANNRQDIATSLGFVHAQERFFQMDLLRRNSAGELSSLFGNIALAHDKKIRIHRFRDRARDIVKNLPKHQLKIIKAYTQGVNQGLKHLHAAPFEYLLLQQEPIPWREDDTILTVFSMYLDLQYAQGERELTLGVMNNVLTDEVFSFLTPKGSQWDAAIDGTEYTPSPLPKNAWPSATKQSQTHPQSPELTAETHQIIDRINPTHINHQPQEHFVGSNNWAISGKISKTQSAIVANDMHLGIRVPNTWYKARLKYPSGDENIDVTGLSLPGTPNIIVGSNQHIAWGFTNSYGDWSDVIILKTNQDKTQYLTPKGYLPFTTISQMIAVKDQKTVELTSQETIWGPVIGENHQGELLAYRWVAHDLNAVNLNVINLEQAKTVEDAFKVAATAGIPAQNLVVGDSQGNIGWTIMGPIPKKQGQTGDLPQDWSTGEHKWQGYLTAPEYPKVKNPSHDRLWTGNSRVVGHNNLEKIGNGGYALGARAQQIRDRLFEADTFDEQSLLNIALDTEARFLKRWQTFLVDQILTNENIAENPSWAEAKNIIDNPPKNERAPYKLKADINSVAYRIVRNFRLQVRDITFEDLNKHLATVDQHYDFSTIKNQLEVPLWQLVSQQPDNFMWLPRSSWSAIFHEALDNTLSDMTQNQALVNATWGQENQATIKHPLASAVPFFGQYLNMPTDPLPGDNFMPRVDGGSFGASERMIVSPGHEETGILHMPTSQAGHPWSPYYGKGHQNWVQGKPSPFLPGETQYKLTLLSY